MPWDQNGGGDRHNPWGSRPKQSHVEDKLRETKEYLHKIFPRGFGGGRSLCILAFIIVGLWFASGFYVLDETEKAVILRLGKYKETTEKAGLHYHLPYPLETRFVKDVSTTQTYSVPKSLMVTGDENIVNAGFTIQYYTSDLKDYLLNAMNPEETLRIAAVSVFRDIIAQATAQESMATNRNLIASKVKQTLQDLVNEYQLGLYISQVDLQDVDPPPPVRDAYLDVQRAVTDRENMINEAEAYRNKVVQEAMGVASRIREEAAAYAAVRIEKAKGEAGQFEKVLQAYQKSPEVTKKRLYYEAMQEILKEGEIVLVDNKGGILPHAALPTLQSQKSRD